MTLNLKTYDSLWIASLCTCSMVGHKFGKQPGTPALRRKWFLVSAFPEYKKETSPAIDRVTLWTNHSFEPIVPTGFDLLIDSVAGHECRLNFNLNPAEWWTSHCSCILGAPGLVDLVALLDWVASFELDYIYTAGNHYRSQAVSTNPVGYRMQLPKIFYEKSLSWKESQVMNSGLTQGRTSFE